MKISQQEKNAVRDRILQTFVELVRTKGYGKTNLNQIAKEAGIGISTIYNYFKSKEQILFAYFEQALAQAGAEYKATPTLNDFHLQEKLQLYIDLILERYEADREFLLEAYGRIELTPFSFMGEIRRLKDLFLEPLQGLLEEASSKGEITLPPFPRFTQGLLADYFAGIAYHWVHDTSVGQSKTTQLTDISLNLVTAVLQSGMINKALDVVHFLARSHFSHLVQGLEHWFPGRLGPEEAAGDNPQPRKTKQRKATPAKGQA